MLLEYFLSSGTPELSSDAKVSLNNTSSLASTNSTGDAEIFKNALNDSIVDRSKFLNNQSDMAYSESDLVDSIQKWDLLYLGGKHLQASIDQTSDFNNNQLLLQTKDSDLKANIDYKTKFVTGEEVPEDGNRLPEVSPLANQEIITSVGSPVESVVAQIKPEVVLSTQNDSLKELNAKLVGTKPTAPSDSSKSDLLPKSSHVTDKLTSQSFSSLQTVKDSEKLTKDGFLESKINIKDVAVESKVNIKEVIPSSGKEISEQKLTQDQKLIKEQKIRSLNLNSGVVASKTAKTAEIKSVSTEVNNNPNIISSSEQKSASILLNEEIKKAKTADFFATNTKENNLTIKPLITNLSKNNPIAFSEQTVTQGKESNPTIVPESLKVEASNQSEVKSQQLNLKDIQRNPLTEQFVQQLVKNDSVSSLTTNQDTTTQNASKSVNPSINGETINAPVQQQVNSNQNISRASEIAIPVSLPTNQWNKKFAEHVSMLALKGASSAQIKLDPPELGPMAVRINHTGSETQIQFQVSNPIARELVDSGMNKLREMLEEHGFENVDVDVSERQSNEQHASDELSNPQGFDEKIDDMQTNFQELPEKVKNNSLVDLFA